MKKLTKTNSILSIVLGALFIYQLVLIKPISNSESIQEGICYGKNAQISKVVYSDEVKGEKEDVNEILKLQGKDIKDIGDIHERLSSEELEDVKIAREALEAAEKQTVFINVKFAEKTVDKINNKNIKNIMQNRLDKVKEQYFKINAWNVLAKKQLANISKCKSKENIKEFNESIQNIPEGNYIRIDLEKQLKNILK